MIGKYIKQAFYNSFILLCAMITLSYAEKINTINIDSLINSPILGDRLFAINEIERNIRPDTITVLNKLALGLREVSERPMDNIVADGTYLPQTEVLKSAFGKAIIRISNNNKDLIWNLALGATGEYYNQLMLMLGELKDSTAHIEIRKIAHGSTTIFTKYIAIRTLSLYKDTLDAQIFLSALNDTSTYYQNKDIYGEEINLKSYMGTTALGALKYMGYSTKNKNGKFEIEKKE